MSGMFISFEGIDGAGKSTHFERLVQLLREAGRTVTATREPGGTPLAEKVRTLLLNDRMDGLTEALLAFAARRDHVQKIIKPALARGEVVVCDRFTDSTFAYQGAGRGMDVQVLSILETWVQTDGVDAQILQPDLTLWFDVPAAIAADRLAGARTPDKFESESTVFFERVAQGYLSRMQQAPQRFARIQSDQSPEAVWEQIAQVLRNKGVVA